MKSAAGLFCSLFLLAVLGAPELRAADPVVSNVSFAQRPGTKLVDITYGLEGDAEAEIAVAISGDGGATWAVPATSLTGDAGVGVVAGVGKAIVWDMGADWDGQHTDQMVVRVTATIPPYLVIDLSGGSEAGSYPVSYLNAVPEGGWTDEHKTTKLVLRRIPAGTFTMGSPEDELGRGTNETQHQVTLSKYFYIGVFQVTQRQYERVMGTWPSYFHNTTYRDARPVEYVSWNDVRGGTWPGDPAGSGQPAAGTFVQRLRDRTGLDLDLPTESQWEYACRAGTATALNSGKNLTTTENCPNMSEVGRYWYNGGSGFTPAGDTSVGTAKAGSYLPNAWGLYDMHGNVYEWCLDWWGTYPGTVTDPVGATSGSFRAIRGGGHRFNAGYCRSAARNGNGPGSSHGNLGFRVRSAVPVP